MFEYNEGVILENQLRISPSSVNDLLGHFPYWFKSKVLKQKYEYGKPDNRVIGTIIHKLIETLYTGEHTYDEVMAEGINYMEANNISDTWEMITKIGLMFDTWKEEFYNKYPKPRKLEHWLEFEPSNRIKISGTCDVIFDKTVFDWKSTQKKKSSISQYKNQLYLYAWLLRKEGATIENVGICFIQHPLKSGNVNIVVIEEPIDEDYMKDLIAKIRTASELAIEAYDNETIRDFLSKIEVKSPYDRSS